MGTLARVGLRAAVVSERSEGSDVVRAVHGTNSMGVTSETKHLTTGTDCGVLRRQQWVCWLVSGGRRYRCIDCRTTGRAVADPAGH